MKSIEREDEKKAQTELLTHAAEAEKQIEVNRVEQETERVTKRKADEETPLDEIVVSKKVRKESDKDSEDSEEEEEEEWQREAAAQLAVEAAEECRRQEEKEVDQRQTEETKTVQNVIKMPIKVDLSIDEAKALFKVSCEVCQVASSNKAFTVAVEGERYQSTPPLGYITAQIRQ